MTREIISHRPAPGQSFFEIRVSGHDGQKHIVRDTVCVCADTFALAEAFALDEFGALADLTVEAIAKKPWQAVFTCGNSAAPFFSVTARVVEGYTDSGKERISTRRYLVQNDSIPGARTCINDCEAGDVVTAVTQTPVTAFTGI